MYGDAEIAAQWLPDALGQGFEFLVRLGIPRIDQAAGQCVDGPPPAAAGCRLLPLNDLSEGLMTVGGLIAMLPIPGAAIVGGVLRPPAPAQNAPSRP